MSGLPDSLNRDASLEIDDEGRLASYRGFCLADAGQREYQHDSGETSQNDAGNDTNQELLHLNVSSVPFDSDGSLGSEPALAGSPGSQASYLHFTGFPGSRIERSASPAPQKESAAGCPRRPTSSVLA